MMAVVVDDGDAAGLALDLEAAQDAVERCQRVRGSREIDAEIHADRERGQRVAHGVLGRASQTRTRPSGTPRCSTSKSAAQASIPDVARAQVGLRAVP